MKRRAGARHRARCVLDSGGLSALVGRSQAARAWFRWVVEHDGEVVLPTPILVETTTGVGGRDAEINRILGLLARVSGVFIEPDEAICRRAGSLRYRAGSDDGIDAIVAAVAEGDGAPAVLLTSDPRDLSSLLADAPHVAVRRV